MPDLADLYPGYASRRIETSAGRIFARASKCRQATASAPRARWSATQAIPFADPSPRIRPPRTELNSFLCVAPMPAKKWYGAAVCRYVVVGSYAYTCLHVRQKPNPVHSKVDAARGRDARSDLSLYQLRPRDESHRLGIRCLRRHPSIAIRRLVNFRQTRFIVRPIVHLDCCKGGLAC